MVVFLFYGIESLCGSQTLTAKVSHYWKQNRNNFTGDVPKENCCGILCNSISSHLACHEKDAEKEHLLLHVQH